MSTQDLATARLAAEVQLLEAEARALEAKATSLSGKDVRQLALSGGVDSPLVAEALTTLGTYRMLDAGKPEKKPIHISMNMVQSDPQSCMVNPYMDMFALIDYIRIMQKEGYKFTMQVTGSCIQQALSLLQVADERIMTPHSKLMITEEEIVVRANSAEARKKLKYFQRLEERARQFICNRSKLTMDEIAKETGYDRKWWFDSKTALERGLVDAVDVRLVPGNPWKPNADLMPAAGDSLEIRKAKAAARKDLAEAALIEFEADTLESAMRPSPILFLGPVNSQTCSMAAMALQKQGRIPGAELSMIIYSPGGAVVDGVTLLDVVEKLKADGHKFNTTAIGCAASMGGYLLKAGDDCALGENALVLIHRISRVIAGGNSQARDQEEQMKELEQEVLPMLLRGSDITNDEYMAKTEDGDWWLEAPEALARKVVNRVV